ncbi:MAG: HAMP domain-containing histidine kinase [Chloroflexi bacterium]|nr:HAMP domain-containing histidine kinase [Chloroflexota bacterium]
MTDLSSWLAANAEALTRDAAAALSQNETTKAQVTASVQAFFDALTESARSARLEPLQALIAQWVETRTTPADDLTPVLTRLKQVIIAQICIRCAPEEAAEQLIALDKLFTNALVFLTAREQAALLDDLRERLANAEHQVEQLDKTKSDFIAIAAHELKTPLTVVEGYTGILRDLLSDNVQAAEMINGITHGLQRLRELMDDIIDIAQLDLGILALHFQPVWLHHLLEALEKDVRDSIVKRHLTFRIHYDTFPVEPTFGDPERLLQVLNKIVFNAIKYTPDGGSIAIKGRQLPGFVDLMVIDSGIGIAPDDLPRIFDPFSSSGDITLHSSGKTKFKGGGPGLGLPIAKGVLEAHGGTIWVQSDGYSEEETPGCTFHVMIPMHETPPDEPQMQRLNAAPRPAGT